MNGWGGVVSKGSCESSRGDGVGRWAAGVIYAVFQLGLVTAAFFYLGYWHWMILYLPLKFRWARCAMALTRCTLRLHRS